MTHPNRAGGAGTRVEAVRALAVRAAAWPRAQGVAAGAVVAVMLVWRGLLMHASYFNQDDFYLTGRAFRTGLTWSYLFRATAGHINPGQQLVYWLVSRWAPYDWGAVATFVVGMQLLATVLMWRVLTRLLPGRWSRVVLLAVFAWSPLTLATTLWWSAAMGLWPHVVCSLWAVLMLIRADQGLGRRWVNLTGCVVAMVVGLAWHERAILIAPTLLGVAIVLTDDVAGWRRIPRALRRFWPLWLAIAALATAFLVVHQLATSVTGGSSSPQTALEIARNFIGENIIPGLASGPWAAHLDGGAVQPPLWVVIASAVLLLSAAVLLVRHGGPSAGWALALLGGYVVADLALVLAGRSGFGAIIGQDPRYSSDVLHAAVLAAALALRRRSTDPPPVATSTSSSSWRPAVALGLMATYLVGSAFSTAVLVPHFQNTADRTFVTNVRSGLAADPNRVLYDELAPADVVLPLVGEDSLLSRILAPLPESPVFDQPSTRLRVVGSDGQLDPVKLAGSIDSQPGPVSGCGYAVKQANAVVPLLVEIRGRLIVHLDYFTDRESTVTIGADGWQTEFEAAPGPNEMWVPVPDLHAQITQFEMSNDGGGTVCVVDLEAGLPDIP